MDGSPVADGAIERDGLGFPEQFVLWCWRVWVLGLYRGRCAVPVVERACTELGAAGAGSVVHRMMTALGDGARRPIDIRPPCYPTLSADEQRLLGAVRYLQDGDGVRPLFLLSPLVTADRRGAVLALVADLSRRLLSAGVDLTAAAAGPQPLRPRHPAGRYDA